MSPASHSKPALALPALAVAALLVPSLAPGAPAKTQLSAELKGNAEIPGPGDPNGRGEGFFVTKPAKRKICFQVSWVRIGDPSAGHIHKGGENEAGAIKVTLFDRVPPTSTVEGCKRNLKRKLVKRIGRNPENYYVNVHNTAYPDGAIRGQLGPAL